MPTTMGRRRPEGTLAEIDALGDPLAAELERATWRRRFLAALRPPASRVLEGMPRPEAEVGLLDGPGAVACGCGRSSAAAGG